MLFKGLCGVCYDKLDFSNCTRMPSCCDRCSGELKLLADGVSDTLGALVAKRNRGNRRLSALDHPDHKANGGQANRAHAKRRLDAEWDH